MSAVLWILAIFAGLLLLILLTPLRVSILYDEDGFSAVLRILFVRLKFPRKSIKTPKNTPPEPPQAKRKSGKPDDLIELIRLAVRTVGKLLKTIRIRELKIDAVIASEDPFKTAMMFGGSGAGVGILLPLIERNFRLEKRTINVNADFEASSPSVKVFAKCSVLIVQLLVIAGKAAYHFWKLQKMKITKTGKDGKDGRSESK